MQNKVLSLMGIATKAGKTVSGEFSVEKAVKEGRAVLVIVSLYGVTGSSKITLTPYLFLSLLIITSICCSP